MKILPSSGLLLLTCLLLASCGGGGGGFSSSPNPPPADTAPAPTPTANDEIRVGDKIVIRLTGVPEGDYVIESLIPASGDLTVPLLTQSFHAAGRNTADLAAEITSAYKTQKIYTNPNVTILPEERYVNVGGDVRGPARIPYTADLTLLSAINSCGGFTEYANRRAVRIIRGAQVLQVDAAAAARTPGADPPVYPGDQIYVPRTMF